MKRSNCQTIYGTNKIKFLLLDYTISYIFTHEIVNDKRNGTYR